MKTTYLLSQHLEIRRVLVPNILYEETSEKSLVEKGWMTNHQHRPPD